MTMRFRQTAYSLLIATLVVTSSSVVRADQPAVFGNIQALPPALKLIHHRHEHSLTVRGRTADGFAVDLSQPAVLTSADPTIATVESGWVKPLKSGQTQITV